MSDRSDQALRERLELAKQATDGPWKESVQIVNGDAVSAVSTACGDEICNTYGNLLCDTFDAAHIAANHPEVVRADLEEILALRAEVARLRDENEALKNEAFEFGVMFSTKVKEMRARETWLAEQVAIFGNPFCVMSYEHECEFCDIDSCRATIKARAECWRKLADMATRENPGISGNFPENTGEMKPCPECGSPAEMDNSPWNKKTPFFVVCTNKWCLTCGPNAEGKESAIEAWNKR